MEVLHNEKIVLFEDVKKVIEELSKALINYRAMLDDMVRCVNEVESILRRLNTVLSVFMETINEEIIQKEK